MVKGAFLGGRKGRAAGLGTADSQSGKTVEPMLGLAQKACVFLSAEQDARG